MVENTFISSHERPTTPRGIEKCNGTVPRLQAHSPEFFERKTGDHKLAAPSARDFFRIAAMA